MSQDSNLSYQSQSPAEQAPAVQFEQPPKKSGLNFWTALVLLALIGTLGWLVFFFGSAKLITGTLASIGENFITENITETFLTQNQTVTSTDGNILVVANIEATEQFSLERQMAFGESSIPGTRFKSTITVPATYQYHVRLDDPWELSTVGQTCVVQAPVFHATLPVAFDTADVEKKNEGVLSKFYGAMNMGALEKSVSSKLERLAKSEDKEQAVRETCRESIGVFVKNWLLREEHWREDRFTEIIVYFNDEQVPDPLKLEPVVELAPVVGAEAAVEPEPIAEPEESIQAGSLN